jgi:energy-coupling factor transporter ATP-binding protein EcfA2
VASTNSPLRIAADERVALVGTTGSGKTTLALALLQYVPRLIVIDPKGNMSRAQKPQWALDEWSEKQFERLQNGEGTPDKPIRVRMALPVGDDDWEPLLRLVMQLRNILVYIDEVSGVAPSHIAKPFLKALYTRGREFGIGTWGAMQRPVDVPAVTLSEANWYFVFRTKKLGDRERLAEWMGDEVLAQPGQKFGFWYYYDQWDAPRYSSGLIGVDTLTAGSEKGGGSARL